jgi:Acetyltransferase (GNAT) domain
MRPIVSLRDNPEIFAGILRSPSFAEIEAHPQTGAYARAYYPAVHGDDHRDLSFAVCQNGIPVVVCLCTLIGRIIGLHGLPLRLFTARDLPSESLVGAAKAALDQIDNLATKFRAREVSLREPMTSVVTAVGETILARNGIPTPNFVAQVDLTKDVVAWRKALRKSFRSLVNWGRREYTISLVNKNNPDAELFDRFREFHAVVAGRVTRPQASWDVMYSWVSRGLGELVVGSIDERLVAASLFIDGTSVCIYMTGAYDRTLFDKPIAHYPLWLGIERAQARGMKVLELGDVHLPGTVSDKEYKIGYFKRGFATHLEANLTWRWTSTAGDVVSSSS